VGSLPKGQTEAGLAIGLTRGQTLRAVLFPQAITAMLPALVGQLVVVLKDTALGLPRHSIPSS
jgi:glutamate transport system permease protein